MTWKGYKQNYLWPILKYFNIFPPGATKTKKPVYAASSSVDISTKDLQNIKQKCWPIYQSVLHATVSLCTAYTLCSVEICKSSCSTHTVKQWLVHITILILGHQTLWWRLTNPPKYLTELCYGLMVWVHLLVTRASNVIQREKRYTVTFCAYPGKTGLYTYPLQSYCCTLTDWFWQFTYEGWSYVLLPTPSMNMSTVKVI